MTQPTHSHNSDDEYMPEAPGGHEDHTRTRDQAGITPQNPSTMPRAEDDEETKRESPEFNDLPSAPWRPTHRS